MDVFQNVEQSGSDILFSLHAFDPPVSPVQDHKTSGLDGAQIIAHVLASARIKNAVTEIAAEQGKTVNDVFSEVKAMLEDIGHTFTLKSIRFMAYILRKVFRNIYAGIKVNMDGLNKVKEMSKECPVVLVPAHRSYTDFLLVSFVCYIFQLPIPVIAAAQDFKNMKLIGGLLRNCGAFYMKRSFRSDKLYWAVFSEYVQCLLLNSGTTMEFFLEGTRSRSGKSLHPKQGLLSIITDLYFTSRVPDIMFCPISISYDRVLEETLMARELLGVPKPRESLKGLLNSRFVLSENYGYAYMYFGSPISLREFSEGLVNRTQRSCIPRSIRREASEDEIGVVRKLAVHTLEKIQENLVILPNMVIASLLLENPTGIDLEILIEKFEAVHGWCRKCGVAIVKNDVMDFRQEVIESMQLLKSSAMVTEDNCISLLDTEHFPQEFKAKVYALLNRGNFDENPQKVTSNTEHLSNADSTALESMTTDVSAEVKRVREDNLPNLKALKLEEKNYIVHLTCIHIQLAHQRNQLLHWFYVPAMAAFALRSWKGSVSEDNSPLMVKYRRQSRTYENQAQRRDVPELSRVMCMFGKGERKIPNPPEFDVFSALIYTVDDLYTKAKLIGDVVCLEIAKESFPSKQEFVTSLEKFKELGMFNCYEGLYTLKQTEPFHFITGLWNPIVTSYWVVCSYILDSCFHGEEYSANTLILGCQEYALQLFLKGTVHYLEIQSLELLRNGIKSLRRHEIVKQIKRETEHVILVSNNLALFNLKVTLGEMLQLNYYHPPFISSKL